MYAGTSYGKAMSHPIMAYHLDSRPLSLGSLGTVPLVAIAAGTGPAAPFVAAALIAAPYIAKILVKTLKGCGSSCTLTSDAANEIEQLLIQNLRMYEGSGRTIAEQQAALNYFDLVWGQLVEFCGQPEFQTTNAGRNCVEDRKRGACKWKDGAVCWNWFVGYRDPIANDQDVKENAPFAGNAGDEIENAGRSLISVFEGKDSTSLLLIAALVGVVYLTS